MEYYFYFYSTISGVALLVHLIINWHQMLDWRNAKSRVGALACSHFLICMSAFFVLDVLWGIFAALKYPRLLFADTTLFFLAMALSVCVWTRYVVAYLEMVGRLRRCLLWTGYGLLALFAVSLTTNVFTGTFFTVNDQGEYVAGPLRNLVYLLLIAFNVFASGLTFAKLRRTEGVVRRRNKMVFAFGLTMTAAIVLQFCDAFLPMYSLGCLFGCCLLHVFVFEDERDEMHRKEMLAREYEAKLEAEHSANQAKSLFFSTVSHDIRTPLNAIIGFSELLELGVASEEERALCVSSIRSSGKMLARLVDDILDLSKMENGKLEIVKEPTDVPALVREIVASFEIARMRKSIILKSEIGEVPWVSVDSQRIRQILLNFLSNAYKYTEHGTVTVGVGWRDGTLALSVSDTGKGIAKENLDRILQPFVQVVDKNHRDGTGLGLPICRKLAMLMGGELTVSSELGVGSTFTVTLRNVQTVAPPARHSEHFGRLGRSGHMPSRVLVVDDSEINCEVLKALLVECGVADVVVAENGREALKVLKGSQDFDMVLTDLWMPELDGYGLVRAIRSDAKLSHLPVYLVTADVEVRNSAEDSGFTGVVLKPITIGSLTEIFGGSGAA